MAERNQEKERTCQKCGEILVATAAQLKQHDSICKLPKIKR